MIWLRPSTLLLSTARNTTCHYVLLSLFLVIVQPAACVSFGLPNSGHCTAFDVCPLWLCLLLVSAGYSLNIKCAPIWPWMPTSTEGRWERLHYTCSIWWSRPYVVFVKTKIYKNLVICVFLSRRVSVWRLSDLYSWKTVSWVHDPNSWKTVSWVHDPNSWKTGSVISTAERRGQWFLQLKDGVSDFYSWKTASVISTAERRRQWSLQLKDGVSDPYSWKTA